MLVFPPLSRRRNAPRPPRPSTNTLLIRNSQVHELTQNRRFGGLWEHEMSTDCSNCEERGNRECRESKAHRTHGKPIVTLLQALSWPETRPLTTSSLPL